MPWQALLLVLVAALLHAIWNITAKRAGGDFRFTLFVAGFVSLVWLPAALWLGLPVIGGWSLKVWGLLAASAVVHLVYFVVLLRGYRAADLTVVYPVARGSAPLITAAAALLLLDEQLSALAGLGVLGVCGGVFLIAGGPQLWRGAVDPARVRAGLGWGALTGLFIAGYSVIDGYGVKHLGVHPVLMDYFGNLLRIPLLLPALWPERAELPRLFRSQWRAALTIGTLGSAGYMLVLYAVTLAPLSHVAPAREVSMLLAALLGGKLLGEKGRGPRLAGAACITLGVVLLALG
jgi:drug/metabolite transporter (DMT)-like permease